MINNSASSETPQTNKFWFNCALFGLVSGVVTMLSGLTAASTAWISNQFNDVSSIGTFSTWLLIVSFALFFLGGYCLDRAYDSFYCRGQIKAKHKIGYAGNN